MIARIHHPSIRGLSPDEAAAYWLMRVDADSLNPREQAQFEAWRAEHPLNEQAFARAQRMMDLFDNADGDPHLNALRESALAVGPEPRHGLWLGVGGGIAASLLAVVIIGTDMISGWTAHEPVQVAATQMPPPPSKPAFPTNGEYATGSGERRRIALADGSAVTLNTDSAVRVAYSGDRRLVSLLRGQVLFDVAKKQPQPFVVQVGDRQVTALGTLFEVRLDAHRVKVSLVEGRVVVDGIADRLKDGRAVVVPTVMSPGQELVAMIGTPQQSAISELDQPLWREEVVEFNDVPLKAAVRTMNGYSNRQLVIGDGATGKLRISGSFGTGNPARFAAIVGELHPIRVRRLSGGKIELRSVRAPSGEQGGDQLK